METCFMSYISPDIVIVFTLDMGQWYGSGLKLYYPNTNQ